MIETGYDYQDTDEMGRPITCTITAHRSNVSPSVVFKRQNGATLFACSGLDEDRPELLALLRAVEAELKAFDE